MYLSRVCGCVGQPDVGQVLLYMYLSRVCGGVGQPYVGKVLLQSQGDRHHEPQGAITHGQGPEQCPPLSSINTPVHFRSIMYLTVLHV